MKSDVWSLGITIIELALGRFPFADEGEDDLDEQDEDDEGRSEGSDTNSEGEDDLRSTLSPAKPNGSQGVNANRSNTTRSERRRKKKAQGNGVSLGGGSGQMSMLELLQRIVNEPPPRLPVAPSAPSQLPATSALQTQRHSRVAPSPSSSQQHQQQQQQHQQSSASRNQQQPSSLASVASPAPGSLATGRRNRRPKGFPRDLAAFVDLCVTKDPNLRPTPKELGDGSTTSGAASSTTPGSDVGRAFVRRSEDRKQRGEVDVKAWVDTLV